MKNRTNDTGEPKGPFALRPAIMIAIPAGLLWGTALGAGAGLVFGNLAIGALIGAGLGVGIGFTVFAAAIVIASGKL